MWYTGKNRRRKKSCRKSWSTQTAQVKGKSVPLQAWSGPEGSRKLRFPDFMTTAQGGGRVVSLTHWPHLPPVNPPGTHFCWRMSRPQSHSAIGRIMSMKISNDAIWVRTSDLLICSTAPKPLCHRGPRGRRNYQRGVRLSFETRRIEHTERGRSLWIVQICVA